MTDFQRAEGRAAALARRLLDKGTPPDVVTNSMLTTALAVWGADIGNPDAAKFVLKAWCKIRDAAEVARANHD